MYSKEEKIEWVKDKKLELRAQLDAFLDATMVDAGKMRELMAHYTYAGIYDYTLYNSCLIQSQGGRLAQSYKKWQALGRYVKKGEKSFLSIFVPFVKKIKGKEEEDAEEEETRKKTFFILKPVFDVSQTEGEPLKYCHNTADIATMQFDDVAAKVSGIVGLPVVVKHLGQERGYCSKAEIAINEASNNTDKIKTLFHEAGHAILHKQSILAGKDKLEVEAESVAAMVLSCLNIQSDLSDAYVAMYKKQSTQINKVGIIKAVEKILRAIMPKIDNPESVLAA